MKTNRSKQSQGNQATKTPAGRKRKPIFGGFATSFADIVDRYKEAVVNIEVMQKSERTFAGNRPSSPWELFFSTPRQEQQARPQAMNIGTGFVFHEDGYILTNEHVIHGSEDVKLRLYDVKKTVSAKVVATNYDLDLAILKAKIPKRTVILPLGHSKDIRVGEWVLAIGNPMGTICHTMFVADSTFIWRNHQVAVA
ncbi:S1C family serine protease [Fodinisporobacter ferrooxydans]|uniref:S1C family serine protease n=1 Tax=Fodinisporobacter ferrooxydans TaxID=2901836 RepID=A0ABY4CJZ3_9BACL|nr:S1C family serine protease [Alicyclobacillaceae bacterium MYW30-H2]